MPRANFPAASPAMRPVTGAGARPLPGRYPQLDGLESPRAAASTRARAVSSVAASGRGVSFAVVHGRGQLPSIPDRDPRESGRAGQSLMSDGLPPAGSNSRGDASLP